MIQEKVPYSIEIEKQCIAGLLNFPEFLPDVEAFVSSKDFYLDSLHGSLFELIGISYKENAGKVDKVIIADKARNIGVKTIEGVDVHDYLGAIVKMKKVQKDSLMSYFKELKKYAIARTMFENANQIKRSIISNINEAPSVLVGEVERMFSDCVTSYIEEDYKPIDLHGGMIDYIESLGENPQEDGIVPPFATYYKKYGGFTKGDFTIFAAPPKAGKSTLLNALAIDSAADPQNNCKTLILDTELETERAMRRRMASLSGVSEFFLRTGKWRTDKKMYEKVRDTHDYIESCKDKVDHLYVANKPVDEICSIVRRWRCNELEKDMNPLIVYDYLKLTGEKTSDSWKEYQVMGKKTDTLKHLFSEIGAAGIGAVQTNAAGDVAMAQQIKWFASNLFILKPKSIDEITEQGASFGTHKLITVATRNQGEEATGFNNLISVKDEKGEPMLVENYINLNFDNFRVTEAGTFEDFCKRDAGSITPSNSNVNSPTNPNNQNGSGDDSLGRKYNLL